MIKAGNYRVYYDGKTLTWLDGKKTRLRVQTSDPVRTFNFHRRYDDNLRAWFIILRVLMKVKPLKEE